MSPTIQVGGRSSVGRASPLQGEGQEFESPRLHHSVDGASTQRSGQCRTATEEHGAPGAQPPEDGGDRQTRIIACLIRALTRAHRPAWRWVGLRPARPVFGRVAPSQVDMHRQSKHDFAVNKGVIPDTSRLRPPGQEPWGSSYKGHGVDALAPRADEGRGRLRKASGSREQTLIRGCPNGETRQG